MALISDFIKALTQVGDSRFLLVFLKSLALTIGLLLGFALFVAWLASFIPTDLGEWWLIGQVTLPSIGLQGLAFGAFMWLSSFLMIPVAAVFLGFFLEDIAAAVEAKHYPEMGPGRSMGIAENIGASLRLLVVIVVANLFALIPYLILLLIAFPLAYLLGIALNGYLLGREYFELVATRHRPAADARRFRKQHWSRAWLAGIFMAVPLSIPIMNLIIPVLGVATITHQVRRLSETPS
ncbi:MAG: EI24 domain-containing protein [Pseudomonadota bacterium]